MKGTGSPAPNPSSARMVPLLVHPPSHMHTCTTAPARAYPSALTRLMRAGTLCTPPPRGFGGAPTTDESFSTNPPRHDNMHANSEADNSSGATLPRGSTVIHPRQKTSCLARHLVLFSRPFTTFYLQAGDMAYVLLRAPDMVSAFSMDPWC